MNCSKPKVQPFQSVVKPGTVEGNRVDGILLDTGCTRTLIHKNLVPPHKLLPDEAVAIRCAHGDTVLYPLAAVELEVEGQHITVEATVSDTLPTPVLLGTDVPELKVLLAGDSTVPSTHLADDALTVVTRARAKKSRENEATLAQRDQASGAKPTNLLSSPETSKDKQDEVDTILKSLGDDIFSPSRNRPVLTRKKKRQQRWNYQQQQKAATSELHPLDISLSEFKVLQDKDTSLKEVRQAAEGHPSTAGIGFFQRDGVLFRRWTPPRQGSDYVEVEQLVLPQECRQDVLKLAHSIPLAGHMGKDKTARRILDRFYWPTLYKDVADFCRQCSTCQKTSHSRVRRAPLQPLPVISEPFSRIAMDIVGPLPRSYWGNKYILVVCDYATRYPEAIPLKSIDAPHIAEELVTIFSRVGVPSEILTDQGSNFTSQLLTEVYRLLHIHPIRTTP